MYFIVSVNFVGVLKKIQLTLELATKAQRGSKGIVLLFL